MKISTEQIFSVIGSTEADSLEYTRMAFDALNAALRPCNDRWNEKGLRGRPKVVWIDTAIKTAEYAELVIVAAKTSHTRKRVLWPCKRHETPSLSMKWLRTRLGPKATRNTWPK